MRDRRLPLPRWVPAAAAVLVLALALAWHAGAAAPAADSTAMRRGAVDAALRASGARRDVADVTPTTIVLVRHAEKDTGAAGADVALSAAGRVRALELTRALGQIRFHRIYTTHWQRNRQTAEAVASRHADSLTVIDDVAETLRALRAEPAGSTVLVVGHIYTIAPLVEGLTGRPFPVEEPISYDGLWIVSRTAAGTASLVSLRYGAPDLSKPEPKK